MVILEKLSPFFVPIVPVSSVSSAQINFWLLALWARCIRILQLLLDFELRT